MPGLCRFFVPLDPSRKNLLNEPPIKKCGCESCQNTRFVKFETGTLGLTQKQPVKSGVAGSTYRVNLLPEPLERLPREVQNTGK
jgi:hypothetical protein